jgi:hypothetical protein
MSIMLSISVRRPLSYVQAERPKDSGGDIVRLSTRRATAWEHTAWHTTPCLASHPGLPPARPHVEDPVIALIAEEERIRRAAIDLSDAADLLFYALPEDERRALERMEDRRLSGEMGDLYRQSEPLYEEANQLIDRIRETKPVTLAGAIAMLESARPRPRVSARPRLFDRRPHRSGALGTVGTQALIRFLPRSRSTGYLRRRAMISSTRARKPRKRPSTDRASVGRSPWLPGVTTPRSAVPKSRGPVMNSSAKPGTDPALIEKEYRSVKRQYRAVVRAQWRWDEQHEVAPLRRRLGLVQRQEKIAIDRVARTAPTTARGSAALVAYVAADIDSIDDWGMDWHKPALAAAVEALQGIGEEQP